MEVSPNLSSTSKLVLVVVCQPTAQNFAGCLFYDELDHHSPLVFGNSQSIRLFKSERYKQMLKLECIACLKASDIIENSLFGGIDILENLVYTLFLVLAPRYKNESIRCRCFDLMAFQWQHNPMLATVLARVERGRALPKLRASKQRT